MHLTKVTQYLGHKGSIYDLCYYGKDEVVISAGGDGWIVSWDIKSDAQDGHLIAHTGEQVFCIVIDEERDLLFAGAMSGQIYVIDLNSRDILKRIDFHKKAVFNFEINGDRLYAVSSDGFVSMWDLTTLQPLLSTQLSAYGLRCITLHDDFLYIGGSDGHIYIVDSLELTRSEILKSVHSSSIFCVSISNDLMYTGGRDAKLVRTDLRDQTTKVIDAHWYTINDLLVQPNAIVTASRDKRVRIWSLDDLSLLQSVEDHVNSVNALLSLPDGLMLVSAGDDRTMITQKVG